MTGLSSWAARRWRRVTVGLTMAAGLAVGVAAAIPGCFVGTSYEKVPALGGSGGAGEGGGAGGCSPVPGACDQGTVVQLAGSGDVVVTDVGRVTNLSIVMVGYFSGAFTPPGGPQVSTTGDTDGFLLELDNAGQYVAHLVLPEVDESSTLRVSVDPDTTDVAVAATVTEGPFGICSAAQEILVWRLRYDPNAGYETVYMNGAPYACIDAGDTTQLALAGVSLYPNSTYINVAGWFDGTLGGVPSTAVDGFSFGVADDAAVGTPWLVGGSGDAYVAAVMPNFNFETVLVGDFSGELHVEVPADLNVVTDPPPPVTRLAVGGRDLFIITFDDYDQDPNLDVYTFGHANGGHRAVDLAFIPTMTSQAVMLAQLDGPIFIGETLNQQAGIATLALTFNVPVHEQSVPFSPVDIHLLRAESMLPLAVGGNANQFFLAGHARGDISVERGGTALQSIPASGCQQDAFLVNLQGGVMTQAQRCGDGQQQVVAASARQGGHVVAVQVPVDGTLDTGGDRVTVDTGSDTFLLLQ